ncbi:MAG: hypothetical protein ACI9U2_001719 [Bradymonadia bacterium]|jgi:hypothetical protein
MAVCLALALLAIFNALHPGEPPPTPRPTPPQTLSAMLDRALYWPDGTVRRIDMAWGLERACAAEEVLACLLIAGTVHAAPLAPVDRLCADGESDACVYAIWRRGRLGPSRLTRQRSRAACRKGMQRACVFWARTVSTKHPQRARRVAAQACAEGEPSGCLLRATLESNPAIRAAQLAAACADGDARGCDLLARLSAPDGAYPDPPQQALARWRGCAMGDETACAHTSHAWPLWVAR